MNVSKTEFNWDCHKICMYGDVPVIEKLKEKEKSSAGKKRRIITFITLLTKTLAIT